MIICSSLPIKGRVYRLKGYEIPEYGRTAKGLPIVNLLKLDEGESIQTIINVEQDRSDEAYLFFTTRQGFGQADQCS